MPKPFGVIPQVPAQAATPSGNPPTGSVFLYFKSDGYLYKKTSTGVETRVESVIGTGATDAAAGNHGHALTDANITGTLPVAQLPTHNHSAAGQGGQIGESGILSTFKDGTAGTYSMRTLGTGALQAAAGNHGHALSDAAITGILPLDHFPISNFSGIRVRAATTANITLSGTQTIDGVALVAGDLVLVKNQTTASQNGVYTVAAGAWSRSILMDTAEKAAAALVVISEGTNNGGWTYTTPFNVTAGALGTQSMNWIAVVNTFTGGALYADQTPVQPGPPASPSTGDFWYDNDDPGMQPNGLATYLGITNDYTDSAPSNPSSGLFIFARWRARRLPAFVGPSGQDSQLQPAMFSNRIARINVINNTATPQFDGIAVTNRATAPAAVAVATTNFYTSMIRARYASIATAGNAGGFRSSTGQWFTSATANMGGMFMVIRFGLQAISATNRLFIGFSTTAGADLAANVNPSTLLNLFGFGCDSTDTQFQFMTNDGTGTATKTSLGASFPTQTGATNFFEFRIFAPSGMGNQIYWSAQRLNDGAFVQGGPITTDLPAINTLLAFHCMHSNGTTASAVSLDLQSLYIETDN